MSTFLFIRHGESEAYGYIAGRTGNIHLSGKGRKESEELADALKHLEIDFILSSPITRTAETAEIIASKLNIEYKFNPNFMEFDFGDFTGKKFAELEDNPVWKRFNSSFRTGTVIPFGELVAQVQSRMVTEIEKIRKEFPDKVIAVVSHGDPIRSVVCYYAGIPLDFMTRITISTASLTMIEINDWGPVVHFVNYTPGMRI